MNRVHALSAASLAIALFAGLSSPASATTAELLTREAVLHTSYLAGFATVGSSGEAGSLTPVRSLLPTAQSLVDSVVGSGTYLFWAVDYALLWNMVQDYSIDPLARSLGGRGAMDLQVGGAVVGPDCAPCLPTLQLFGRNQQALEFELDTATRYEFSSTTTTDQWVDLLRWDAGGGRWAPLWNGFSVTQGVAFSSSGELAAGRYRVQNNPGSVRADNGVLLRENAWEWTLTLPDAAVTAVPEPGSWALMAVGVGVLARVAARRRSARWRP